MANIVYKINNVDFSDVLEEGGLVWERNDLDAEGTGRDLNGDMLRDRTTTKVTLKVSTIPLTTERISQLLQAIYPQTAQITYLDPQAGTALVKTMYVAKCPATCQRQYGDTQLWDGVSFSHIEC